RSDRDWSSDVCSSDLKFGRSVRLPEGDVPAAKGSGLSKSAASRHFVALSSEKLDAFMSSDLSKLDLLVIQIDGLHVSDDLMLVRSEERRVGKECRCGW